MHAIGTPAATLQHCTRADVRGVYVAVAPTGHLVGAAYTQRISSRAALLQPETALDRCNFSGPILELLEILQHPQATVAAH